MTGARIGIFGGTFDPIHVGHLFVAEAMRSHAALDRVLFVPVDRPAHRKTHAPVQQRCAMLALAIAGNKRFALDDTAVLQSGPVYTADTLALMRSRRPHDRFFFIAGADSLAHSRWRRLDEVAEALEEFFVVSRRNVLRRDVEKIIRNLPTRLKRRFTFVDLPLVDVSATEIRARIALEQPIRYLTPDAVARYVREHGLYRAKKKPSGRRPLGHKSRSKSP